MSLLRLERGDTAGANQGLQAALGALGEDRLPRLRLLPSAVLAALAAGDLAGARIAVAQLGETADIYAKPAITATAEQARGTLELEDGSPADAARRLQSALGAWQTLDAPYDAAITRALLAEAYLALGDRNGGLLELESAQSAFERLGAQFDLARVTRRLHTLGT